MKVYIAKWCSCEPGGYNYSDGILSLHSSYQGAEKACEEYMEKEGDADNWTEIEDQELMP